MSNINQQPCIYPIPPKFKSEEKYLRTLSKNQRKKYYRYKRVAEDLLVMKETTNNNNTTNSTVTNTTNNSTKILLNDVNGGISLASEFSIQYYAKVLKITKYIEDTGKISIKIVTDMDKYFKSISNEAGVSSIEHIYNTNTMREGDIYKVVLQENRNCDKLYWVWIPYHTNEENIPVNIDINQEYICPVCKQKLTTIDHEKYCINDQCPSKLRMSIRRYLQFATKEIWTIEDIITFDKLVTLGRVKTVADIYTLSPNEINSLEPYFAYSELDLGESIVTKINNTRGTISIFNFINSLCLPKVNGFVLNKKEIDKIDSIETFLVLLANNDRNEYTRYMSGTAAYILRNYFNKESTMSYITRLIEEQVFDS